LGSGLSEIIKLKTVVLILIQGILFDEHSSFQQGPALAPPLIREALTSDSGNSFSEDLTDIKTPFVQDAGDFNIDDYFEIESITRKNLSNSAKLLTLGGDHSITFPVIKAYVEKYSKLYVLQIDAHGDLYDDFEGVKYSHASPFARIMEAGIVQNLVQVGVRTLNPHQKEQADKFGVEIHEMNQLDLSVIKSFENPLYISLDLDGLDPAYAPGVSHHEPGGLSTRDVINLIQSIDTEVVGADIVEYNPHRDFQQMTAYVAAKLMKELLAKLLK
jgi:agmatinase